jgi:hypothetical protein
MKDEFEDRPYERFTEGSLSGGKRAFHMRVCALLVAV